MKKKPALLKRDPAFGYQFRCKACGEIHLCISMGTVNKALEENGTVSIQCYSNQLKNSDYIKSDLMAWYGEYWETSGRIVTIGRC